MFNNIRCRLFGHIWITTSPLRRHCARCGIEQEAAEVRWDYHKDGGRTWAETTGWKNRAAKAKE